MTIIEQRPGGLSRDSDIRIALIGYGAIGRVIANTVLTGAVPGVSLVGVHARGSIEDGALPWCRTFAELLDRKPDLLVEAAGAEALAQVIIPALACGIGVLALSVAALADATLERDVRETLARNRCARLMIPSGAIAGLDAIAAAREQGLDEVVLIQRKPPLALMPAEAANALTAPKILTDGSAREAALRHPRTSNVAAALALAGIGFDRTRVRVIADPAVSRNSLEMHANGRFGELEVKLYNRPSSNPQTSELTIMSLLAALRRHSSSITIPM